VARRRDYRREYQARQRRGRGLPSAIRRGHGPLSIEQARAIERGGQKGATRAEKKAAAEVRRERPEGVKAYRKLFGKGKNPYRPRPVPRVFPTRRAAQVEAQSTYGLGPETEGIYYQVEEVKGGYKLTIIR